MGYKSVSPPWAFYLLRRLRQRGAVARARWRMWRESHDGMMQSLIELHMKVDVLHRLSAAQSNPIAHELGRIQELLREEVAKQRALMLQMKLLEVDSSTFVRFLGDRVERFQRETGIGAHFVSDLEEVHMPPRVCRELAHVVEEALGMVRNSKFSSSGARESLVRLSED